MTPALDGFERFERPRRRGRPPGSVANPGLDAQVAELRFEYGLSNRDIAAELGITPVSVSSRLHRYTTRRHLKDPTP